jgi:hypothetical protein
MSRTIITQCNTADFKFAVGLATSKDEEPTPVLSNKQKLALSAVAALTSAGLTFDEIYTIKELLVWSNGEWVYRFHRVPAAKAVRAKLLEPATVDMIGAALKNLKKGDEH